MNQTPPRDDDPSGMTDFEKNTASEELEQLEQEPQTPDKNRAERFSDRGTGYAPSDEDVSDVNRHRAPTE
jgi:hypothetical protein